MASLLELMKRLWRGPRQPSIGPARTLRPFRSPQEAGFGLVRANPGRKGTGRKLSDFDAASLVRRKGST